MINRRGFLMQSLALGCSAAASPLMTPIAFANADWDNRLVVIVLRGAMDGLDVLRPVGDIDFAALRPTLAGDTLDLNGFYGFHPALAPLLPLWQAGELGAVHATSTPYRDKRSHFDGQDILEAGIVGDNARDSDGWLNRLMQTVPRISAEMAYAIGREQMLILTGAAPVQRWSPEAQLQLSPQARRLLELVLHDDPLFRDASAQAVEIAEQIKLDAEDDAAMADMMSADPMMAQVQGNKEHVQLAEFAAARLRGASRIASFSLSGWDTHYNQKVSLTRALARLSDTILALRSGLGPIWGQTGVLCITEFGRTARENGTKGTDHGTGGALLFAGGALQGGQILGQWPGLRETDLYDRRDLMPTSDVRAHLAWAMAGLFGVNRDVLETAVFPGLAMGPDLGIVRA